MPMNARLLRPLDTGFNPRRIANLGLWLDASNTSSLTFNSTTVSEWRDLSGNGRHFAQTTAAAQPNGTARTQNGRRVLDFAGSQSLLGNAASLSIARNVGGLTVAAVCKLDVDNANQQFFVASRGGSVSQARSLIGFNLGLNALVVGGRRTDADSFAVAGEGPVLTDMVLVGVLDYANSDAFLFRNGSQTASNTSFQTNGNTSDTNSDAVGVGSQADGSQPLAGFIAELIVYQRALSTAERQRVERSLGRKWGIAVA
jgi:hypothetical protein